MKINKTIWVLGTLLVILGLLAAPMYTGQISAQSSQPGMVVTSSGPAISDGVAQPTSSHRLIFQLHLHPFSVCSIQRGAETFQWETQLKISGCVNLISKLQAKQAAFVNQMSAALPTASVSQYINELGAKVDLTYQVSFNGMAIDPGST